MEQLNMENARDLANPHNLPVGTARRIPQVGDLVIITSFKQFTDFDLELLRGVECSCTVSRVIPVVVHVDGSDSLFWEYEIYTHEFPKNRILGWHFDYFQAHKHSDIIMHGIEEARKKILARRRFEEEYGK